MHCIPAGLEDKSRKSKAERIAFDLLEYLDQINYNKYYDSMAAAGTRGGEKEKQFSDFSSQSIKAAQVFCSLKQTTLSKANHNLLALSGLDSDPPGMPKLCKLCAHCVSTDCSRIHARTCYARCHCRRASI